MPGQAFTHHPATYQPIAFAALGWPGTFEAAMQCTARREIIEHIAIHWPRKPMENIRSISSIDMNATDAARRGASARSAIPYPEHTPAGQLWLKCFAAEQARLDDAAQAQAESVYTDD